MMESNPDQARQFYQETILANPTTLIGLLDQVVERGETLNDTYTESMNSTISLLLYVLQVERAW